MSKAHLTKRMQAVCNLIKDSKTVCDVGCDHGFVPIYLVKERAFTSALAMDINEGPLAAAGINIEMNGVADKVKIRLSDGLKMLLPGEAEAIVIAGMGGRLIVRILEDDLPKISDKLFGIKELILQPQSELLYFRKSVRDMGFVCEAEDMVLEDGKFYPMGRYVYKGVKASDDDDMAVGLYDKYGQHLLENKNEVLRMYLEKEKKSIEGIVESLNNASDSDERVKRLAEVKEAAALNELALKYFE